MGRPKGSKAVAKEKKFLVAENTSDSTMVFRHPSPEKNGLADLVIKGYDSEVIEPFWLDVPWFVRYVNLGTITTYREDAPPPKRNLDVTPELTLDDRLLDAQSLSIVTKPKYDSISRSLVNINPMNLGGAVDRDWLRNTGIKFLRNVISREKKWRNRPEVLSECEARIRQINEL
jgi:hypothetical protein